MPGFFDGLRKVQKRAANRENRRDYEKSMKNRRKAKLRLPVFFDPNNSNRAI
jgi:hypothetical protein